jgi:hypothetical protein
LISDGPGAGVDVLGAGVLGAGVLDGGAVEDAGAVDVPGEVADEDAGAVGGVALVREPVAHPAKATAMSAAATLRARLMQPSWRQGTRAVASTDTDTARGVRTRR